MSLLSIKRSVASLFTLTLLMTSSGCGFKDLDKRFIAVSIGIDQPDDPTKKFKVEVKLAIPSPEEKFGSNQALIVTQEADSITEAVRLIKSKIDKELDFGHTKAIILGEKFLKKTDMPLPELMDWFTRRRDIQMIAWMGIGEPDALSVLKTNPKTERLPSNQLFVIFGETGTETAYVVSTYMFDFYRRMMERGLDPILPVIKPVEADQLIINRVAIFDKEKWILTLTPMETKLVNAFYHKVAKTDIPVKIGDVDAVIAAQEIHTSYSLVHADSDHPIARVNYQIDGQIEESKKRIPIEELPKYENLTEQVMKERITFVLQKLQKAGVDPIGFGLRYRAIHATGMKEWEQWRTSIYPSLEFQVTTRANLQGTGVIE